MNILTTFPRLMTARKTQKVSSISNTIHEPTVDHNEPPTKPPTLPTFGNYCFRAFTTIVSADEPVNDLTEFIGFDDKMTIVKKVEHYCERNRRGDETKRCTPTKLSFMGPSEMCDGRVLMYDKVHDVTQVYF